MRKISHYKRECRSETINSIETGLALLSSDISELNLQGWVRRTILRIIKIKLLI